MRIKDLDPRVGVALPHCIIASEFVPLRCEKARHQTRWYAKSPEHDDHCGRIVLAIPGLSTKQKIVKRMEGCRRLCVQTVLIPGQQVGEDGGDAFMRSDG
jgi:hypothetical protein